MTVSGITEVTNDAKIIDSREVIERIRTLESWEDDPDIGLTDDESQELADLRDLAEEGEGLSDWRYGVTLIRDDYFEEYAQEFFEDTRDSNSSKITEWPYCHIDWEAAADALKEDYTSIDFGDETYWGR